MNSFQTMENAEMVGSSHEDTSEHFTNDLIVLTSTADLLANPYSDHQEESHEDTSIKKSRSVNALFRKPNSRTKYSGKTVRCKTYDPDPDQVRSKLKLSVGYPNEWLNDNVCVIKRTAFESPDSLVSPNLNNIRSDTSFRSNLNTRGIWSDAIETLLDNATNVRIVKRSNLSHLTHPTFEFDLPVTDEITKVYDNIRDSTSRKSKKKLGSDEFVWRGKTYSKSVIYTIHGSDEKFPSFTPVGQYTYITLPDGTREVVPHMKIKATCIAGNYQVKRTSVKYYWYWGYSGVDFNGIHRDRYFSRFLEKYQGRFDHIEFDFGKDTNITHIATMGMPYIESYYPQKRRRTGMPKYCYIRYTWEQCNHYVSRYEVQVRQHSSKNWISLGYFAGNSDRLHEKINQFETPISVQYVRVIPIDWGLSPSMCVRFFGAKPNVEAKDNPELVTYQLEADKQVTYHPYYSNWRKHDSWWYPKGDRYSAKRSRERSRHSTAVKKINMGADPDDLLELQDF